MVTMNTMSPSSGWPGRGDDSVFSCAERQAGRPDRQGTESPLSYRRIPCAACFTASRSPRCQSAGCGYGCLQAGGRIRVAGTRARPPTWSMRRVATGFLRAQDLRVRNSRHNSAALFAHYEGVGPGAWKTAGNISIYWFEHGWTWMIPLPDGVTGIGAVCMPDYLKTRRGGLYDFIEQTLRLCPKAWKVLKDARRIVKNAVISLLAGDLYRGGALAWGLSLFREIYAISRSLNRGADKRLSERLRKLPSVSMPENERSGRAAPELANPPGRSA